MQSSVVQPRHWLINPKRFGKDGARWQRLPTDATPETELAFETARVQHTVASYILHQARRQGLTRSDIAEITGFPNGHRHLGAVLRGEAPMTLRQLVALQTHFPNAALFGGEVEALARNQPIQRSTLAPSARGIQGRRQA